MRQDQRLINAVNRICQKYIFDGMMDDSQNKDEWVKITIYEAEDCILQAAKNGASSEAIHFSYKILDVWKEYYQTL